MRKTSLARNEASAKKQLCEDAVDHYQNWQNFVSELNSKCTQTSVVVENVTTQTIDDQKQQLTIKSSSKMYLFKLSKQEFIII